MQLCLTKLLVSGQDDGLPETLTEESLIDNLQAIRAVARDHSHPAQKSVEAAFDGHMMEVSERRDDEGISLPCPHEDCTYSTIRASDERQLDSLIKLLSMHLKVNHGQDIESGSSEGQLRGMSKEDKAAKELEAATTKRDIKKVVDDATLNLCEARFFAMPLNLKVLSQNMPITQSPVNTVIDFSRQGVNVTHPELLRKLHSRVSTDMRLGQFSDSNLKGSHTSGDALVAVQAKLDKNQLQLGKPMKELSNVKEAVRAAHNYCILARNFHPLDTSPQAFFRVVLEMYLNGPPTVQNLACLFEKFIHENAVRAHKKEVPLSYKEILDLWNTYIVPSVINRSTFENMINEKLKSLPTEGKSKRGSDNSQKSAKKQRRMTYCPNWNKSATPPFCSNQQAADGCIDATGNFLSHSCSKKFGAGFCGSSKHNIHTH